MQGWIMLHRKMIEWEWFKDPKVTHLFLYLLLIANHKDGKWQGIPVKRGQLITGLDSLRKGTGLSIQSIRTCLSKLEKTGELTSNSTNKYRTVTLCNYDTYQLKEWATNKQANNQPTSNQQSINNQSTANNNVNNNNNENNDKLYSLQDVKNAGCLVGFRDPECLAFHTHYNAQGWLLGNGLPIADLSSAMTKWRNNGYKFPDKPKAPEDKDTQMQKQWEQRFGDFIRTGQIKHIKQDRANDLRNPKFRAWAEGVRPELKGVANVI